MSSSPPRAPGRVAEVVVRLGDTILDVRHLTVTEPRGDAALTRAIAASVIVVGLVLLAVGVAGAAMLILLAGAAGLALAHVFAPGRPGDRYRIGEGPTADLPLQTPEAAALGEAALVRVVDAGVMLALVDDLDGEIVGADADAEIAALRAAGWRVTALPEGARATLRRGSLTIEVRSLAAAEAPTITLERPPIDRGVALSGLGALVILGGFFVSLTAIEPAVIDLGSAFAEERQRIVSALAAIPEPEEEPKPSIVRELPPDGPRVPREATKKAPKPEPIAAGPTVEIDGEQVAAPRLRTGTPKFKRRRGGGVHGSAQEESLAEIAEEWLAIETESAKKYVDSKEDFDAWAALTSGPPIARGFGGLELEGKGRPGGGKAEGAVPTSDREIANAAIAARGGGAAPVAQGLRVGAPKVRGALDRRHVGEVAQQQRSRLVRCWSDAHAREPGLKGSLKLEIKVDSRGRVDGVSVPKAGDAELGRCVAEAIRGWRFDAPSDGGGATIVLPLSYG